MNIDRAVLSLTGSIVLVSVALAWSVGPYWLALTAFVGAHMFCWSQHAACSLYRILPGGVYFRRLGFAEGPAFQ